MATIRLSGFPVNTSPSGSFLIYMADSGAGFEEVQVTVDDFFAGYSPALVSIAGLTTSANQMLYLTGADTYATTDLTAYARTLLSAAAAINARSTLGLVIGTDVQAYSAALASIAGLTTSADKMIYTSGADTYATTDLTALGRTLLADSTASDMRSTLGLGSAAVQNDTYFLQVGNNLSDLNNASTARTNLGLGTMATQSASSYLALAGGTMVGTLTLNTNSPAADLEAASKGYVDSAIASFASVFVARLASTTALTVTYSNGASGVGATLTNAGAQAAFSLDGVSAALNDLVLIKDQASSLQNGYYKVTTLGSGASNWVLTRSTTYDQPSEIQPGDIFIITAGSTQVSTSWLQTATVTAVGTDAITFSQYSVALPIPVSQGGTGKTSLTAYGIMTAGTTSTGAMQQVTIGAAGTMLRSGGASALPTFSTATYPDTAGTAGNVMTSDGTNWVSSAPAATGGLSYLNYLLMGG